MNADQLAVQLANTYQTWKSARNQWELDIQELRNYLFATSTRDTTNSKLPWRNSTTLPKLTQIRDNLHANYMAAMFPNDDWLSWVASDQDSVSKDKRVKIEAFMKNRLRESGFRQVVSQLVYDYIDYGNAIAGVTFANESITAEDKTKVGYVGPKLYRISPYDMVFDPSAPDFVSAPKITRTVKSLGELAKEAKHNTSMQFNEEIIKEVAQKRQDFHNLTALEQKKVNGYQIDGFGSINLYFESGMVEILEFEGDIYDIHTQELLEDQVITIIDRSRIIRQQDRVAITTQGDKRHVGWRPRPDNLYAQGPLDNLVGMQYRIDHLENLRADAFDMIAYPIVKVRGEVEPFTMQPLEHVYIGEEGDVSFLHPDPLVLQADNQIALLERRMEEYAGAPKEAMGVRTPGEKTAFEVQQLQNAASRIFQNKTQHFEAIFLEPLINIMFEVAKQKIGESNGLEKVLDPNTGVIDFIEVTGEDIKGSGKFYPRGARHFAAQAKVAQDLNNFFNSPLGQDPQIRAHISGKEIAKLMDEVLGFDQYRIFQENVHVAEQAETAQLQNAAAQVLETENQTPIEQL